MLPLPNITSCSTCCFPRSRLFYYFFPSPSASFVARLYMIPRYFQSPHCSCKPLIPVAALFPTKRVIVASLPSILFVLALFSGAPEYPPPPRLLGCHFKHVRLPLHLPPITQNCSPSCNCTTSRDFNPLPPYHLYPPPLPCISLLQLLSLYTPSQDWPLVSSYFLPRANIFFPSFQTSTPPLILLQTLLLCQLHPHPPTHTNSLLLLLVEALD